MPPIVESVLCCSGGTFRYFVDEKEVTFEEWMAFFDREVPWMDFEAAEAANRRRSVQHECEQDA